MTQYFFACDHTPYMFDTEIGRIYQLQATELIDVTHTAVPRRLRLDAAEITRREALRLAGLNAAEIDLLTGAVDDCLAALRGETPPQELHRH